MLATAAAVDFDAQYDDDIAQLLQKHVINLKDKDKVRRILDSANDEGYTMLHAFCQHSMSICVNLLLENGVDPNTLYRSSTKLRRKPDKSMKVYTPSDVAAISMENWKEMLCSREGFFSREEFDIQSRKYHEILEALQRHGGRFLEARGVAL